jgi:hypothetical protein
MSHSQRPRWTIPAALCLSLACAGACAGIEAIEVDGLRLFGDYEFPAESELDNTLALYLTDEGFDFVEAHGLELLALYFEGDPGRLDLSEFVTDYLAENPIELFGFSARDIQLTATLPDGPEAIEITVLGSPTRLNIVIRRLWVSLSATVFDDSGSVTSACRVAPEAEVGAAEPQSLLFEDLELEVVLAVTPAGELDISTELVNLGLVDTAVHIVTEEDDPDYYCNLVECQDGCFECELFCEGADLILDVADYIVILAEGLITDALEAFINQVLGDIKELEGELHPAVLLGGFAPVLNDAEWLGFLIRPSNPGFRAVPIAGRSPDVANDLSLNLRGGVAAPIHPCVDKIDEEPDWAAPPGYAVEAGDPRPHVVISLTDTVVDQTVWSAYTSGALCLYLGTDLVRTFTDEIDLNVALISLLLPGLDRLAPPEAPLMLSLRPHLQADDFPIVQLGSGDNSLLSLALDEVDIGLYAWVEERYLRLFELRTQVNLGLTPVVLPENQLKLAIDSVDISLLDETYNELFTGAELTDMVNFALELATTLLIDGDTSVDFSLDGLIESLLGIPINVVVDRLGPAGSAGRWLELALRLESTESGSTSVQRVVDTRVEVLDVGPGTLDVEVWAPGYSADQLEFQIRHGFGAWRGFQPAGVVRLESTFWRFPGEHTVEVRARVVGDYRSLDSSPAVVLIDAPRALRGHGEADNALSAEGHGDVGGAAASAASDPATPPAGEAVVSCRMAGHLGAGWLWLLLGALGAWVARPRRPRGELERRGLRRG